MQIADWLKADYAMANWLGVDYRIVKEQLYNDDWPKKVCLIIKGQLCNNAKCARLNTRAVCTKAVWGIADGEKYFDHRK